MFTRFAQIGVWICIAAVILTGCIRKEAVKPSPQSASLMKQEEVQSDMEREMVILFQSLIQMDKQAHLVINKKQAEELLPEVKHNTSEGGLTLAEQQIIVSILTVDQRLFVINYQKNMHEHIQKEIKERDKLDREERERMVREFQLRRQEQEQYQDQHQDPSQQGNRNDDSSSELTYSSPLKKSNNVEQRLIHLLENRVQE